VNVERKRQLFADKVLPHLDDALSLARWLTGNLSDAEDVVQDACIRAYGAIETHKDGSPRAWLLAIVRNTAFTWLAKNRSKDLIMTDDIQVFEQAARDRTAGPADPSPEAAVIAKSDAARLHQAIAALPLPYREVLVLREIEDLSYAEIASVMSVPAGTVMSRLARARRMLIDGLGESGAPASIVRKVGSA
jgi:RNA polymerase sigma-70 factor, ECF subfamily